MLPTHGPFQSRHDGPAGLYRYADRQLDNIGISASDENRCIKCANQMRVRSGDRNAEIDLDVLADLIVGLRTASALEIDTLETYLMAQEIGSADQCRSVLLAIIQSVALRIWAQP